MIWPVPVSQGENHHAERFGRRNRHCCAGNFQLPEAIKGWIGRLENEKAVLENDAADAAQRKTWEEMHEYLTRRAIRIGPYLRADLSRLRYRLRPRDIRAVWSEIRADRRHGLQWSDRLKD